MPIRETSVTQLKQPRSCHMQATLEKLLPPQEPVLDISAALAPLASQAAAANNLFFKLAFLHTTPAAEQYSSLSVWLQRVLLGARHDFGLSPCKSLCGVGVSATEVLGASAWC